MWKLFWRPIFGPWHHLSEEQSWMYEIGSLNSNFTLRNGGFGMFATVICLSINWTPLVLFVLLFPVPQSSSLFPRCLPSVRGPCCRLFLLFFASSLLCCCCFFSAVLLLLLCCTLLLSKKQRFPSQVVPGLGEQWRWEDLLLQGAMNWMKVMVFVQDVICKVQEKCPIRAKIQEGNT